MELIVTKNLFFLLLILAAFCVIKHVFVFSHLQAFCVFIYSRLLYFLKDLY